MTGDYPPGMAQADHDREFGGDCPKDRGFKNEICQGCSRFHSCAADWPHPSDCKCRACLEEAEENED